MKKEERFSPTIIEEHWKEIRPHLTKQIMAENPDKPLEVKRMMKQIDEVNHQMTEILTGTFVVINQMQEMMEFHEAAKRSILYQQQKQQKKSAHLEVLQDKKGRDKSV